MALCETDAGDNCLRLIDAASMQQVLAVQLAPGHHYTTAMVASLPCTSAAPAAGTAGSTSAAAATTQAASAPGTNSSEGPQPCSSKEFVVLASYLLLDPAHDPRVNGAVADNGAPVAHRQQGMLTFLEVLTGAPKDHQQLQGEQPGSATSGAAAHTAVGGGAAGNGSSSTAHYSTVMHGACAIPSVALSLATARASPHLDGVLHDGGGRPNSATHAGERPLAAAAADSSAAAASGQEPQDQIPDQLLLAGCHDGVYLFSVHVDDVGSSGSAAVASALKLVGQVDELKLPVPAQDTGTAAAVGGGASAAQQPAAGAGGPADGASRGTGDEDGLVDDESGEDCIHLVCLM